MALAAFLVRGGIVLVVLPIVSLPTEASAANAVAPLAVALGFGAPTPETILRILLVAGVLFAWLIGAGLAGAALDLRLTAEAAADDELELDVSTLEHPVWRAMTTRFIVHIPTALAIGYASVRLGQAAYDELLHPGSSAIPIAFRVLGRAPDAALLLIATWLVAEAIAGLATRALASGAGVGESLLAAARRLVTPSGLATLVVTTMGLIALAVPFWLAASRSWDHLRAYLVDGVDLGQIVAALALLVAIWILGLALIGLGLAWRSAAWTQVWYATRVPERAGIGFPDAAGAEGA